MTPLGSPPPATTPKYEFTQKGRPMKLTSRLSISVVLAVAAASAQDLASFPQYTPHAKVNGTLVVWGNDGMVALAKRWEDGFHKYQPDIRFEDHLYSPAAGIGGLYAGHADL